MDLVPSPSEKIWNKKRIQCVQRGIKTCNQRICDDVNSIFDFLCLFQRRHQTLTTRAGNCLFLDCRKHIRNWVVLNVSSSSYSSMLLMSLYGVKRGNRGVRHGPEDWQKHHWKAKDATRNVKKRGFTTTAKRWKDDLPMSRNPTGTWMDPRVLHLSGLPQHSRHQLRGYPRRKNSIPQSIRVEVERRRDSRKMSNHFDFKKATRSLAKVKHQEGQEHAWFHWITESDNSRSTSSHVRNSDGNVKIINKFMDRRRHPLQSRQPAGNPNNGKNDDTAGLGRIRTDILTRRVILQISLLISFFCWFRVQTSANVVHATEVWRQQHQTVRAWCTTDAYFSRHAHCSSYNAHALAQAQDESHL